MKKTSLTLLTLLILTSSILAQIPKEAFELTNSLPKLWRKGKNDKAVETSIKLYNLRPSFLTNRIHNTLAQRIEHYSKKKNLKYLEQLHSKNNKEINEIISPILLWCKTVNTKNKTEAAPILAELNSSLADSSNYKSRAERYYLLTIKELAVKEFIDNKTREELIKKIIKNIEKYPFINDVPENKLETAKRAWHRFILAYSYNYLYSNFEKREEYLKLATQYSPDQNDKLYVFAYSYDTYLLNRKMILNGYKTKYQKYLANANRKSEALDLLFDITFNNPTDTNIELLKSYFTQTKKDANFKSYWEKYINKKGIPVPEITLKYKNEDLDLSQRTDKWIYIDIWGTWCKPCRKELPELQAYYTKNQTLLNSKLKIYTFSYKSKDLSTFMTENSYSFPVTEIDKKTSDLFEVSSFPTKILITPNGKYIKIPYGENWKMYIKNYILQ